MDGHRQRFIGGTWVQAFFVWTSLAVWGQDKNGFKIC